MGLDVYLKRNDKSEEVDSTTDPKHLFKRGYFRSSYNGGGFDSVMRRAACPSLDQIFSAPDQGGDFKPDWGTALLRAEVALEQYREHLASPSGGHFVDFVEADRIVAQNEREALELYAKAAAGDKVFKAYSSREGNYWLDGVKIKAAIPGKRFGSHGLYLVMEDGTVDGERDWYETALLIVIETIEYVLASDKPEEFGLYWSA